MVLGVKSCNLKIYNHCNTATCLAKRIAGDEAIIKHAHAGQLMDLADHVDAFASVVLV
jgi:hypothetical protein